MKGSLKKWLAVIPLVSMALAGCSGSNVPAFTDPEVPITVRVNQEFTIWVPIQTIGQPYFWEQTYDKAKLALIESTCVICSPETQNSVGIYGSYDVFRYRALTPGQTTVKLTDKNPITLLVYDDTTFTVNIQ
jgi:predicted secreted protein